ncbi:tripartite tricarboxylate transporter TctB family protein [Candidatus Formimonas warabiya]|uniref:DUF1468 domain-containing protein n=1 Tax=Formimonas warabiya TaxID=1761012 RepID=A0A3G1KR98_FORW1|nr:tripartite tricarboxylate transporter TctB family protein [Candidatus Formimonas warabiya]ATW25002.1 hypothetical protein DCMF_09635 [Candidatus Formimonas warabiya]
MSKKVQKIVFSGCLLIIFLTIFVQSLSLPATSRQVPEAVSFIAIVLLVLQIIEDQRAEKQKAEDKEDSHYQVTVWYKNKSLFTGVAAIAYMAVMNILGYVVSTLLFMAALMALLGQRGKVLYILSPAVALGCWLLFGKFFHIHMPQGFLF